MFPLQIVALFVEVTDGKVLTVTMTALLDMLKHSEDVFLASA